MKFDPLSEEQIQQASLIQDGVYPYQVIKSEDKISKAGNEYIALTIKVWDNEGKEHLIFTNMALIKLLKHFCDVNNMQEIYAKGEITADQFLNKTGGNVVITMEPEKPNPNGGYYPPKNIVKDYIFSHKGSATKPLPESDNFINDDLPF